MKAKDFIEEFGWIEAKIFVVDNISFGDVYDAAKDKYVSVETDLSDLKQYVVTWELVQENGGIKEALEFLRFAPVMHPDVWKLKDAIELVESIEVRSEVKQRN